jgi:nitrate reductase gamma subunit
VRWRQWLIRAALAAEVAACWLLLYSVEVGLPVAYTLPFAAVAVLLGAVAQRQRRDLSSWLAYGPALAGALLPSLALVLVGNDPVWRWVGLFGISVAIVIVGAWRGLLAPEVVGSAVAVVVTITEMIRLLAAGQIGGAVLVALAGAILVAFGAVFETRRRRATARVPRS